MNDKKNGRGRPTSENPKIHLPRIKIYRDTIEKLEEIALKKGRNKSDIYQEALDLYLRMEEKRGLTVTL